MKAKYITISEAELDKRIRAELTKYAGECYDKVTWDVFQQALAVCFTALEMMGWRKKRLARFNEKVEAAAAILCTGVLEKEYSTKTALDHLRDKYGIIFDEAIYNGTGEEKA